MEDWLYFFFGGGGWAGEDHDISASHPEAVSSLLSRLSAQEKRMSPALLFLDGETCPPEAHPMVSSGWCQAVWTGSGARQNKKEQEEELELMVWGFCHFRYCDTVWKYVPSLVNNILELLLLLLGRVGQ